MYIMKLKTVYTNVLKYAKRIRIISDEYEDENLYIGLYTMSGEPYTDITTNLGISLNHPLGYVEANSEAERFVKEQKLGTDLNRSIQSGFNKYNLYKFEI